MQTSFKAQGTVWVSGTYHSIYQCGHALRSLGYHILNDISWFKPNASPNLSCRFFTASHETLIWARKEKKAKHTFNYKVMVDWKDNHEKDSHVPGKQMRSVWTIGTPKSEEKKYGKHPTQKPLDLLKRIVLASTNKGDIVLDPFTGSSTTGIAAIMNGRKFIGIDLEKKYLDLSIKRINDVKNMIKGGKGGGNTLTGLNFERERDVLELLKKTKGYSVKGHIVFYKGKEVARSYRKHSLYYFLAEQGVKYKEILSKRLLPDEALYVIVNNTMYILELKFQRTPGSVDEKLQTCDFKKKQYQRLFAPLNYEVEYIYILSDWFSNPRYKDELTYINSVGCQYYFHYLPLQKLGLPVPK